MNTKILSLSSNSFLAKLFIQLL